MRHYRRIAWVLTGCFLALTGCAGNSEAGKTESGQQEESILSENQGTYQENALPEAAPLSFTDALQRRVNFTAEEWEQIQNGEYKVAVLSGSLAQIWVLAGGELTVATEDAFELAREKGSDAVSGITEATVNAGSLKTPNAEVIAQADVDIAILSAELTGHLALEDTLDKLGIKSIYLSVEGFEDYLEALKLFTRLTGQEERYEEYGEKVAQEVEAQVNRQDDSHPKVLLLRAYSSGVKAKGSDNMTGQMLKDLGCENVADSGNLFAEEVSLEAVILSDPDYIFVTTMGDDTEAALRQVQVTLADNPAWEKLSAIQKGNYYVLPKDLFHNKPNERWAESYEMLADILYPEGEKE